MNKKSYLEETLNFLQNKIKAIEHALNETQESANSDSKSSAGDKHETSRAMAHLENERLAGQLANLQDQAEVLYKINPEIKSDTINFGSIVITDKNSFFISVGIGKILGQTKNFYAIASNSPVGKNLLGKKVGDSVLFVNSEEKILSIN